MKDALVIVVGAGIGGLAAAVALHKVCQCRTTATLFGRQPTSPKDKPMSAEYVEFMLLQVGFAVKVLEKSSSLREEGASINIATNGWKAMDALGVADTLRKRFCRIERYLVDAARQ